MVRVTNLLSNETCDKCKKPITPESTGIDFYEGGRSRDRNIILLHYSCLEKLVNMAKKNAETEAVDRLVGR